ncbi:hypothetical protein [Candidatus Leptofilum sp.]|uniref:hypothetical protein n=1 Tax=Candidatus Leptofilum sp. TaxID=3241576 RepID=UPI003B5AFEDA
MPTWKDTSFVMIWLGKLVGLVTAVAHGTVRVYQQRVAKRNGRLLPDSKRPFVRRENA